MDTLKEDEQKEIKEKSVEAETFTTELPSFIDPGLKSLLSNNGVVIRAEPIQEEANSFHVISHHLLTSHTHHWVLCLDVSQGQASGHDEARRLLREYRHALDALATTLLENETLNEKEILEVTGLPPARHIESQKQPATV